MALGHHPRRKNIFKENSMFAKSLIAAAAVAASLATIAPASEASAKTKVFIGLGFGGFYPGYGYGYDVGYGYGGISCWKGKQVVQWAGFHDVNAFDCGGPVYQYKARKSCDWYKVKVNWNGNIIGVKHL
jgi:hypothetical protein